MDNFDAEKFIVEVRKRRWLWDNCSPEYSNRDLKKQSWEELVDIFGGRALKSVDKREYGQTLQKRWKSIRGCYTRELNRQKHLKSGSVAGPRKSEYLYFRQLQFLQSVVTIKDVPDGHAAEEPQDEEIIGTIPKVKRHKTVDSENDLFIKSLYRPEEDEDRMFLLSLLSSLKNVPQEKKMMTKIKLMTVLNEATQNCCSEGAGQEEGYGEQTYGYDNIDPGTGFWSTANSNTPEYLSNNDSPDLEPILSPTDTNITDNSDNIYFKRELCENKP